MYRLTQYHKGIAQSKSLRTFLAVGLGDCIAFAGAGGKTSSMFALARELSDSFKVAVITTTRLQYFAEACIDEDTELTIQEVTRLWDSHHYALVATLCGEKLGPCTASTWEYLRTHAEVILYEADGARGKPFKFPREGEPVYLSATTKYCYIAGMLAYNQPLSRLARPALLAEFLHTKQEHLLSVEDMARVINSSQGARKALPRDKQQWIILNQIDTPQLEQTARYLATLLKAHAIGLTRHAVEVETNE